MAEFVIEPRVCQQVGPAFSPFTALGLEGHLLQQVLHVLVLEEVGGCRGSITQHADGAFAVRSEEGAIFGTLVVR